MATISLEHILSRVKTLPTLPTVAQRISELINNPNSDHRQIVQVLSQDQSLTTRVLTLANSSYYAIRGGASDIRRAISYLGFNTIYQLVLTVSIFDALPSTPKGNFNLRALWKHSLGAAIAAETIAKYLKTFAPEELFTAGLLHDIGKLALATISFDTFQDIINQAHQQGLSFRESEKQMGLPIHDDIGRRLAEKWQLPSRISAGIGYHHKLTPAMRLNLIPTLHPVADIVGLANILCRRSMVGNGGDEIVPDMDGTILGRLHLNETELQKIQDHIPDAVDRSKEFLRLID